MGRRRVSSAVGDEHMWLTAHHSLRCVRFNRAVGTNHPNEEQTGLTKEKRAIGQTWETVLGSVLGKLVVVVVPRAERPRQQG